MNTSDSEAKVHEQIVDYLKLAHPRVVFRTDFGAGIKLPMWLAKRQKRLQYARGFPDLFIYQPRVSHSRVSYYGLAIEIKKGGTRLKRVRDGEWASEHYQEQYDMLHELSAKGYACAFAVGFDQAVDIIELYLSGRFNELTFTNFILENHSGVTLVSEQGDF